MAIEAAAINESNSNSIVLLKVISIRTMPSSKACKTVERLYSSLLLFAASTAAEISFVVLETLSETHGAAEKVKFCCTTKMKRHAIRTVLPQMPQSGAKRHQCYGGHI